MTLSRGLKAKAANINNKTVSNPCPICRGAKQFAMGSIDASAIKNLNLNGNLDIIDDCKTCNGTGKVSHVMRLIKRKKGKCPKLEAKRVP